MSLELIDISNEEYHNRDGISSSVVKNWISAVSPKHFLNDQSHRVYSSAFRFGSVFHEMVLENKEPEIFHAPINEKTKKSYGSTTKKYIEAMQDFEAKNGENYLSASEYAKAKAMQISCMNNAGHILGGEGLNEKSFFAKDSETGLELKCRPDRIKGKYLIDLKTCAKIGDFEKSIAKYLYHVQAAFYIDVFEQATGLKMNGFCFVAVEKSAPFDCAVYFLSGDYIDIGRIQYKKALIEMMDCQQSGNYPGIMKDEKQSIIDAPYWMYKQFLEDK